MDTRRSKLIFYLTVAVVSAIVAGSITYTSMTKFNPKDEIVREKCIDGYRYAVNGKKFKRQLLDENNNPLRCLK